MTDAGGRGISEGSALNASKLSPDVADDDADGSSMVEWICASAVQCDIIIAPRMLNVISPNSKAPFLEGTGHSNDNMSDPPNQEHETLNRNTQPKDNEKEHCRYNSHRGHKKTPQRRSCKVKYTQKLIKLGLGLLTSNQETTRNLLQKTPHKINLLRLLHSMSPSNSKAPSLRNR